MKQFTFLCVILLLYSLESVTASSNSYKEQRLMTKMFNLVQIYNEQLDERMQWNVLNEAVESIQELFKGYQGKAKDNMKELLDDGLQSHDEYLFAVVPLFQWCVTAENDLAHTASVIQRPNLSESVRSNIRNGTKDLLLRGVNRSQDSISHIKRAIQHMSKSGLLLNATEIQFNEDFRSNGFYDIKRSELVNQIISLKASKSSWIAALGSALGFVTDPLPTLEQKLIIFDEFYTKLRDALVRAKQECRKVDEALKTALKEIIELANDIQTCEPDDMMIPEFSSLFVDSLNVLSNSCKRYVASHRRSYQLHQPTMT